MKAARSRTQFEGIQRGGFVDVDRRIVEPAHRIGQLAPVFVGQAPGAHLVLVELADTAEHTHDQLRGTHFHGEHADRQARLQRHVLRHVQRERGLAHRRTAGHDDQVARLQPGRHLVEIGESGGHTGHVGGIVPVVEHVDALDDLRQQRLHVHEALLATRTLFRNREYLRFRFVEQLPGFLAHRVVGGLGDFGADFGELAHDRPIAHDFRVTADIGSRGRVLRQCAEIGQAANAFEFLGALQAFRNRDDVSRPRIADQLGDVPINEPVVGAVKIRFADHIGDLVPSGIIEQQPAKHGLLGLHRVRRQLDELDLGVGDADALRCELRHGILGCCQCVKVARTDLSPSIIRKLRSGARRKIKRAVFTALFFATPACRFSSTCRPGPKP